MGGKVGGGGGGGEGRNGLDDDCTWNFLSSSQIWTVLIHLHHHRLFSLLALQPHNALRMDKTLQLHSPANSQLFVQWFDTVVVVMSH